MYDVSGRLVRTLLSESVLEAGGYETQWDGTDGTGAAVASGVYFYHLTAGGESVTRKMILIR